MSQPDTELMCRWQRGDSAAFAALVARWQQPVAHFLSRMVGQSDRIQDLCQEVFLRVLQASSRYRETGKFSTWLFQIALNVARDNVRRNRTAPGPLNAADGDIADGLAELNSPSESFDRRELAQAVECAVAELPVSQREVLALRHDQGLSFEEISRVLAVPASTLKSRFAVALNRLRARLNELGWSFEEMAR